MATLHQQRLVSMLEYLEHWDKLNRTPVFDVVSHQGLVLWQGDIQSLPGIHLPADHGDDVWLALPAAASIHASQARIYRASL